ncbi:hypothetical protein PHYBOEH_007532 [Phytophthora boehmeriae]|uniref:M96 mating-specific protein family n=1 Tax=Phytophthora boehmeriae TaxID=109152 RepID=A0A8T1W7U1_9STRA|nr:hypothetical protein PHYBOEH_007532 [Phytophthora boehmeriae]
MASDDDLPAFSLSDVALSTELLPGFLDDLSDADFLPPSTVEVAAPGPSFNAYQAPFPSSDTFVSLPSTSAAYSSLSNALPCSTAHGLRFEGSVAPDLPEMSSGQASQASQQTELGVPRQPMQNSTRKRQKAELNYLRAKVQDLEQELASKRRELMNGKSDESGNKNVTVKLRGRRARWQRIAKHQLVEKQRAEMQNLQLRESLMDQLKLAKSLQKLLKKHAAKGGQATEAAQLRARLEFSKCSDGVSEAALYENLLSDMDEVYAEVESVCARHAVMQNLEEGSDVSSLHIGETDALYLEATNSKIIPFGMEETCSAVWHCLSQDHVKLADGTYHGVASSPDSIRAKAIMTLRVNTLQAHMQMRFAMKKFVEKERVVLTLESASESEGPRDLLHGLKMMQRAWVVIRPVPAEPEDAELDGEETPEETIIQLCIRLTPSLSTGALDANGQRTGVVTELLLAAVHRNLGWLFQTVENILMTHSIGSTSL